MCFVHFFKGTNIILNVGVFTAVSRVYVCVHGVSQDCAAHPCRTQRDVFSCENLIDGFCF